MNNNSKLLQIIATIFKLTNFHLLTFQVDTSKDQQIFGQSIGVSENWMQCERIQVKEEGEAYSMFDF